MQKPTRPVKFPESLGIPSKPVKSFDVQVLRQNTVSVSWYSALLQNLDIRAGGMSILNLNTEIVIHYGTKVYLEIYFDNTTTPVAASIRFDDRWYKTQTSIKKADGTLDSKNTYPNELEIISSDDIKKKLDEIKDDITLAQTQTDQTLAIIDQRLASGTIGKTDADLRKQQTTLANTKYKIALTALQNSLNKYFPAGSSSSTKKLLRMYKLLAYTTKDTTTNLYSQTVTPDATTKEKPFQLVQCVNTDLLFVDYCFKGIPAKILIPWTRPVYQYQIDGKYEDVINTKVAA